MKYTKLGNSDLEVSRICLGCMGFGEADKGMHKWTLPYNETKQIIAQAIEEGINFFDTAMAYQSGSSEQFVGRAIQEITTRDKVILATKYSPRNTQEQLETYTGSQWIHKCIDDSLTRLNTDYVDLYIMHQWDFDTSIVESMQTLNEIYQQGKVREIGISNCYAWQLAKANAIAKQHGWKQFVSIQSHYNLIAREDERELIPLCKEDNIALTPYSALASGRLARKVNETSKRMQLDAFAKTKYDATAQEDDKIIERVSEIAEARGVSMTEVSLAWLLTKVTSPVVGATKPHHIDGAVKAMNLTLTEQEIQYLEQLYVPHEIVGVLKNIGWRKQAE